MPIKFRCQHCHQFLGISRTKAGEIADCPMCGKTLRVPDLDGTVKPLPKPKLNLQDSSLVDALGELAGIGSDGKSDQRESARENELVSVGVQPAAEPVVLEPLEPAVPVPVTESPGPRPGSSPVNRSPETDATGEADEATGTPSERPAFRKRAPRLNRPRGNRNPLAATPLWIPATIILGVVLLGALGLFLLNPTSAPPAAASDEPPAEPQDSADAPPTTVDASTNAPAITGRITYVSAAGDTRPDEGAKVIALPAQRGGTVKFDVAGFMVGSGDVDADVAAAALRALGGDLVTANEQGEYAVTLPDAGSYQLLVISRHQSRPWEVGVESDTLELLDRYFLRPSTLLGQLAYDVQQVQYRGQGTSPRDIAFKRQ